ncbi:F-box/lrr-repeat protein 5, partial [Plakobranchus ocellatus]
MAPHWPEEVDVFTVPHSRMKKLINQYNSMVMSTDFRDEMHLMSLLQNLNNVFNELKAHERIENIFIMRELRSKLRAASISDPAVCNCHSDNRLTEMQDLVLDGYKWAKMPQRERQMYGRKLRQALENFTENFLPHMDMEEQVFQPMLMEYFSYEELKALKVKVIKQHGIYKYEESSCEKFVADSCESEESSDEHITKEEKQCQLDCLPNELCLQILSWLGPQDMGRMNQVSRRWANLTHDPKLWTGIFPVHWAMGNWSFHPQPLGEDAGQGWPGGWQKEQLYFCTDEDADVDESGGDSDGHTGGERTDSEEGRLKHILQEAKLLTALVKHVLPKVGSGVRQCDLAFSRGLSNNLVHKILKLCPNLEILDLKQTLVGDAAFR